MKLQHLIVVCFLFPTLAWSAVSPSPTDQVRETIDGILLILRDGALNREARWQQIGGLIQRRFDFESMSQRVLSTNWKKATREEQRQFVEFFSQYLEDTYRSKIEAYTDEQVRYVGEKVNGERAVVDTTIVTDKAEIPVSYKLKQTDGEWLGVDVVIEGVSLVSNYRNTFAAIVKTEGMEGLLSDLQRRIARQKSLQQD